MNDVPDVEAIKIFWAGIWGAVKMHNEFNCMARRIQK